MSAADAAQTQASSTSSAPGSTNQTATDASSAAPPEGALFSTDDINFPFMVEDAAIELAALQIWDAERRQTLGDDAKSDPLPGARALMIASGGETAFALAAASPSLFDSGRAVDMNAGQYHMCLLKQALFKQFRNSPKDMLTFLQNRTATRDCDVEIKNWRKSVLADVVAGLPPETQAYWLGNVLDTQLAGLDAEAAAAKRKRVAGFYEQIIAAGPFSLGFRQQGALALCERLSADHLHPDMVDQYYRGLAEEEKETDAGEKTSIQSTSGAHDLSSFFDRFFTKIGPLSSLVLEHSSRQASAAIASARKSGNSERVEQIMQAIRMAYAESLKSLHPDKIIPSEENSPLFIETAGKWSPDELATQWVSAVTSCIMPIRPWASTRISYIIARALAAGDTYNWFVRSFYASFARRNDGTSDGSAGTSGPGVRFLSSDEELAETYKWVNEHLRKVTSESRTSRFFLPERVEVAMNAGDMTPPGETSLNPELNRLAYSYPPGQQENSLPICYRDGVYEHVRPQSIKFEHKSFVTALEETEPGTLDFIHVSNIMDWLPEAVNKRLLDLIDRALAKNGVCTFRTGPFDTQLRFGLRQLVATKFDVDEALSDFFRDTERCYIYYDTVFAKKRKATSDE